MPFFRLIAEPKSGDAIKCHRRHGTLRALASPNAQRFPSTTLIRLYELLKNDSRSFDRTGKASINDGLPVRERNLLVEVNGIEPMTPCLQSRCSPS
jgi:hypothetical protein